MSRQALAPLGDLFSLNTKLFRNALAELDEVDATARPNGHSNNVSFIAGHLVETRAWMARYLGAETAAPFGGVLEHATSIDHIPELPKLADVRLAWDEVSRTVAGRLSTLSDTELGAPSVQQFPGVANTVLGGIAFLVQHESYHVGQLAFLRKYLGRPPMSYR